MGLDAVGLMPGDDDDVPRAASAAAAITRSIKGVPASIVSGLESDRARNRLPCAGREDRRSSFRGQRVAGDEFVGRAGRRCRR